MHADHPMRDGLPPDWADGFGFDEYGPWVEVYIDEATLRMRWIPPGTFMMGSPESEEGRFDHETEHAVTITRGYWLADAPVTQLLWQTVTGESPSRYQHPDHPVESVSWEDVQGFIDLLNTKVPELEARLPTEAEWERACRAGTTTARYGDLNAVAWHGRNGDRETHSVREKQANAWGLHDTLGNVDEWCADWYGEYQSDVSEDPVGPTTGSVRVYRGGSWRNAARHVRAACRSGIHPGDRFRFLGFRLSRGPAPNAPPLHSESGGARAHDERRWSGAEGPQVSGGTELPEVGLRNGEQTNTPSFVTRIESRAQLEVAAHAWIARMPAHLADIEVDANRVWRMRLKHVDLTIATSENRPFRVWHTDSGRPVLFDPPVEAVPRQATRVAVPVELSPADTDHILFGYDSGSGTDIGSTGIAIYKLMGDVLRPVLVDELDFYESEAHMGTVASRTGFTISPARIEAVQRIEHTNADGVSAQTTVRYAWSLLGDSWRRLARFDKALTPYNGSIQAMDWLNRLVDVLEEVDYLPHRATLLAGFNLAPYLPQPEAERSQRITDVCALAHAGQAGFSLFLHNTRQVRWTRKTHTLIRGLNRELIALKPFTAPISMLVMNPWPRPDLTRLALDESLFRPIEAPTGRWHVEEPPGSAAWRVVHTSAQSTIDALPVGSSEIFVSAPYALGFAIGLWLTNAQADPRYWQPAGPSGGQQWVQYGVAISHGDPVLHLEPMFESLTGRALREPLNASATRIDIGITHAIDDAEVDLANTQHIGLRPRIRGHNAIPDARAAQQAAWDIAQAIRAIQRQAPRTQLHIFYSGPLAVLMMAAGGARTFSDVIVYERLNLGARPRFEPAVRIRNGRVTLITMTPSDHMRRWFFDYFGDPEDVSPRHFTADGPFFRFGGPYDAVEVLTEEFGARYTKDQIAAAAESFLEHGGPEWARIAPA